MRLKLIACAVVASIGVTAAPVNAEPEIDEYQKVDAYLEAYAEQNELPGLAAAVIGPDGVEHEYLYGEDGNKDPITADTPFLIGSIAKTMTATIVMRLERQGKLTLGDRVNDHIDFLPEGDPTIEQLLTHTGGFSSADGIAVADRSHSEPGAIRRAVESLDHTGTIGEYEYTSAGYLVLGAIVEAITGRPYSESLDDELLGPLGMDESTADANLPPGHRFWWGKPVSHDPPVDDSGTPYASVASTLTDLETYATAQLRGPAIPARIREEMQRPWVKASGDHYGLGWSVTEIEGQPIVHHTGATPGYFGHLFLVPERGEAVVLLTNVYSQARAPSLAAGAEDVWRILEGDQREPASSDALLSALPWILTVIAALGIAVVLLALRRPVRRTWRYALAATSLLIGTVLWLLPGLAGYDLRALMIWLPDAAWSLIAGLAAWALACLLCLLPPWRSRRTRNGFPVDTLQTAGVMRSGRREVDE